MRNFVEGGTTLSRHHRIRASTACLGMVVAGVVAASPSSALSTSSGSACDPAESAAVISWNSTASDALSIDAALPPPIMSIGMAYIQAAVYNADEGIVGGHTLYKWNQWGPSGASQNAAVAAAAHRILDTYFPVAESLALAGMNPRVTLTVTEALAHAAPTLTRAGLAGLVRLHLFFTRSLAAAGA